MPPYYQSLQRTIHRERRERRNVIANQERTYSLRKLKAKKLTRTLTSYWIRRSLKPARGGLVLGQKEIWRLFALRIEDISGQKAALLK